MKIRQNDSINQDEVGSSTVEAAPVARLPTEVGEFDIEPLPCPYYTAVPDLVLKRTVDTSASIWMRIHDGCATGDIFKSSKCDCGQQLAKAQEILANQPHSYLFYLVGNEGRGIGLSNKLRAYQLQDSHGLDTVDANLALGLPDDAREYQPVIDYLLNLQANHVFLLTNNPKKCEVLESVGISVTRVPLQIEPNEHNRRYLQTKRDRVGHML